MTHTLNALPHPNGAGQIKMLRLSGSVCWIFRSAKGLRPFSFASGGDRTIVMDGKYNFVAP